MKTRTRSDLADELLRAAHDVEPEAEWPAFFRGFSWAFVGEFAAVRPLEPTWVPAEHVPHLRAAAPRLGYSIVVLKPPEPSEPPPGWGGVEAVQVVFDRLPNAPSFVTRSRRAVAARTRLPYWLELLVVVVGSAGIAHLLTPFLELVR